VNSKSGISPEMASFWITPSRPRPKAGFRDRWPAIGQQPQEQEIPSDHPEPNPWAAKGTGLSPKETIASVFRILPVQSNRALLFPKNS
jgi:hypothetical protein